MAEVIVNSFLQGDSWESTRALMGLLERLPPLDVDLLQLVRDAPKMLRRLLNHGAFQHGLSASQNDSPDAAV
jgi:hypothetical protein